MNDIELFTQTNKDEFYLMNKDEIIAQFVLMTVGELEQIKVVDIFKQLPEWYGELAAFIQRRRAPKKRENIAKLLELSGCNTLRGYFDVAHALSLIDTFWVKRVESDLCWKQMSLYTHEFNEVIAKTAFEGGLHGYNLSTTSPEYGTDGTFAKCWIREKEQIKLLKRGSSGARNAGLEPFSELYVSQIAEALKLNSVSYDLRKHNDYTCSVCDIFTSEQYGYVPYNAVDANRTTSVLDVVDLMGAYGFEKDTRDMFVFDAIVFNEDRHKGNFGFIADNDTHEIVSMAPLFDHNVALLCYAEEEDFSNLEKYLEEKGPRIGDDFVKVARTLLTQDMRKKLINLRGFEFKKHPKYNLPDWRLQELSKAVNRQIDLILE